MLYKFKAKVFKRSYIILSFSKTKIFRCIFNTFQRGFKNKTVFCRNQRTCFLFFLFVLVCLLIVKLQNFDSILCNGFTNSHLVVPAEHHILKNSQNFAGFQGRKPNLILIFVHILTVINFKMIFILEI